MREALRGTTNANPSCLRQRMKWQYMHAGISQLLKNQFQDIYGWQPIPSKCVWASRALSTCSVTSDWMPK